MNAAAQKIERIISAIKSDIKMHAKHLPSDDASGYHARQVADLKAQLAKREAMLAAELAK